MPLKLLIDISVIYLLFPHKPTTLPRLDAKCKPAGDADSVGLSDHESHGFPDKSDIHILDYSLDHQLVGGQEL
jgi:hypothetical protein